jgi:hypothetical protein
MANESDTIQIIEWFRSLSLTERREKVKSLREFFDKNTGQLLKTVRSLEEVKDCPTDLITSARQLIANNMKMMNTLDQIEGGVDNAEKTSDTQTSTTGTTAAGE